MMQKAANNCHRGEYILCKWNIKQKSEAPLTFRAREKEGRSSFPVRSVKKAANTELQS